MKPQSHWSQAAIKCPNKDFPIKEIVYLDQNYRTFKYFLTGDFDLNES